MCALIFDRPAGSYSSSRGTSAPGPLPHGCVDLGESALEACKRQVKEETGITYLHHCILVRTWEGVPVPDGREVVELGFFALALYAIHRETIEDYRSHRSLTGLLLDSYRLRMRPYLSCIAQRGVCTRGGAKVPTK